MNPPSPCSNGLLAALAFYTRLAPPCAGANAALPWNGAAGLVLGLAITLPSIALAALLSSSISPLHPTWGAAFLPAWLWLILEIWLTRGMHWDAAADLGDALGSGATGKKFRLILKDSRMGAFGAISLFALLAGQLLAAAAHFATLNWQNAIILILAPAFARLGPAWLGWRSQAYSAHSLGAIICRQSTGKIWLWAWLQGICAALLPSLFGLSLLQPLLLLAAQFALNKWFRQKSRLHGGISGDFFGCQIETSQLLYLLLTMPV